VEFRMGSPVADMYAPRATTGPARRRVIDRTFAVAMKELSMDDFLQATPDHQWERGYTPEPGIPAVTVTWLAAAEYCNWLSEQEGIPSDQWCYDSVREVQDGREVLRMRIKPGHLNLAGYRLPTEAEWEFAARAGAVTRRFYGRNDELLTRYARCPPNASERVWPCGQLRPNDLGLFDVLGNVEEWVESPAWRYVHLRTEDVEDEEFLIVRERPRRLLRGGSVLTQTSGHSVTDLHDRPPSDRYVDIGFRPVRTLPE
jgi:formylglycine-generating enzyme required for sulfatase activity